MLKLELVQGQQIQASISSLFCLNGSVLAMALKL